MDKTQEDRIDYVAPQVVDLGRVDALYGGDLCEPGSAATDTCRTGYQAALVCDLVGSEVGGP
jgi:hypothetical protein